MPLYDTSGNLVALTRGTDGTPVEKYAYSPFGEQRIFVDLTRPRIEQLRREGDALLLEVSEKVQLAALDQARENGDLTLTDTSTGQPIEVEVSLPVLTGRTARKRIRIYPTTTIAESTPLRLHLAPKAVLDFFQNPLEAAYDRDLVWSATGSALIEDTAAPQLDLVRVHENVLTVAFTETIDVAQATTAITVDGNPVTWIAEGDGYGLRTDPPLANGQHRTEIAASLADLAGTPLGTGFTRTVEITPAGALVYVRPDPREISSTAASNPYGFQGLPRDPETGFVYARNRYYDPEIGRFISTDPLGYVDGGNLYQYGLNDPVNNADPLGLANVTSAPSIQTATIDAAEERARLGKARAEDEARKKSLRERRLAAWADWQAECGGPGGCIGSRPSPQDAALRAEEQAAIDQGNLSGTRWLGATVVVPDQVLSFAPVASKPGGNYGVSLARKKPTRYPSQSPRWKAYEDRYGGKQTPMETTFEGKVLKVRLDKPPSESRVLDFKDYDWANPAYSTPFIRERVKAEFERQIATYRTIRPDVHYQFSQEPPAWVVEVVTKGGATYSVAP